MNDLDNLMSGSGNPLNNHRNPQNVLLVAGVLASVINHAEYNTSTSENMTAEEIARRENENLLADQV